MKEEKKQDNGQVDLSKAKESKAQRFSLVWVIPIIALIVFVILLWNNSLNKGPQITIKMPSAESVEEGKTLVKLHSVTVGRVTEIKLDDDYDFILLDCPPSLGLETMNALAWADYVLIPLQCEYLAMEGLNLIMRTIGNVKKGLNTKLKVLGILFTMYSKRALLNQQVVEDISQFFPDLVFKTIIPRSVRISEAPSHGLPINYYDRSNAGSKAFAELAKEVVSRVE